MYSLYFSMNFSVIHYEKIGERLGSLHLDFNEAFFPENLQDVYLVRGKRKTEFQNEHNEIKLPKRSEFIDLASQKKVIIFAYSVVC